MPLKNLDFTILYSPKVAYLCHLRVKFILTTTAPPSPSIIVLKNAYRNKVIVSQKHWYHFRSFHKCMFHSAIFLFLADKCFTNIMNGTNS